MCMCVCVCAIHIGTFILMPHMYTIKSGGITLSSRFSFHQFVLFFSFSVLYPVEDEYDHACVSIQIWTKLFLYQYNCNEYNYTQTNRNHSNKYTSRIVAFVHDKWMFACRFISNLFVCMTANEASERVNDEHAHNQLVCLILCMWLSYELYNETGLLCVYCKAYSNWLEIFIFFSFHFITK